MNLDILNFAPGYKRVITIVLVAVLYGWHEAFTSGAVSMDVPSYVIAFAGLFGVNAVYWSTKNSSTGS